MLHTLLYRQKQGSASQNKEPKSLLRKRRFILGEYLVRHLGHRKK